MPNGKNGKNGDNPLSDMIIHGKHPFPEDIENMLWKLREINPELLGDLEDEPFDWAGGKNLDEGRELLKKMLAKDGGSNE